FVNKVWISLVRIVFVRRMIVKRVAKHIRDKSAEVVALNVFGQGLRSTRDQVRIDSRHDALGEVHGSFQMGYLHPGRQWHLRTKILPVGQYSGNCGHRGIGSGDQLWQSTTQRLSKRLQDVDGEILAAI